MSNDRRNEKTLDSALDGKGADEETRPLVDTAERVKQALAVDVPPADRQRALFLSGVAMRERRLFSPARILVPALAIAFIAFGAFAGQSSLADRGPLRDALNAVGIGQSPNEEIDGHLFYAAKKLEEADDVVDDSPTRAQNIAIDCLGYLQDARRLLPELDGERAEERLEQITDFEDDAVDILIEAREEQKEALEDRGDSDDSGSDDHSGSGSDDSGSDDSGSGSGHSGSGDSGSGSGHSGSDDSGSGDSGSGSDDSGSGDSGSGSGHSGSGDSGSGSDDSGSGDSDSGSSGSGSGDND